MLAIYPSLISSNLLQLQHTIDTLSLVSAGFHIDIMDFHFVPNLTWGPAFSNAIHAATINPLWIHLMVDSPEKYLPLLTIKPADIISVHYESAPLDILKRCARIIKDRGARASLALKPSTSPHNIFEHELHAFYDDILIMSVEPGFSGQAFLPQTFATLESLATLQEYHQSSCSVSIDGGITPELLPTLRALGVQNIAAATSIFGTNNPLEALKRLSQ